MKLQVFAPLEGGSGGPGPDGPSWHLGDIVYAATTTFAGLVAAIGTAGSLYGVSASEPIVSIDALLLAAVICLIGRVAMKFCVVC